MWLFAVNEIDWLQYGVPGVVLVLVTSAATFLSTKGLDAWLRWRKNDREEEDLSDAKKAKGYEFVIADQGKRITNMDAAIAALNCKLDSALQRELECERRNGVLAGQVALLTEREVRQDERIKQLEQEIVGRNG